MRCTTGPNTSTNKAGEAQKKNKIKKAGEGGNKVGGNKYNKTNSQIFSDCLEFRIFGRLTRIRSIYRANKFLKIDVDSGSRPLIPFVGK